MNQAVVFYNPFLPELKISINGKKLSSYSSLMSYRHQRFEKWCNNLFSELYREINSDYEMICVSSDFVSKWLEKLSQKDPHCLSFESQPLPIATSVYERLAKLELLGCENFETTYVPIINASEDNKMISAVYDILQEQGVFEDVSEDGIVWSECQLANVELVTCNSYSDIPQDHPCVIALCGSEDDYIGIDSDVPVYAFVMDTETQFIKRKENKLYFSVDPDDIGEVLTSVLEEEVLCPILSDLSFNFPTDEIAFLTESEKEDLMLICQASPICNASIPAECDVGRMVDLHPQVYPSDMGIQWRVVSDATDVVEVDDGIIYPRTPGMAEISVYVGEDPYPAVSESVIVYKRELITSINLFPSVVYMPIGANEKVNISVLPENAQNKREICWESSNPEVAVVDAHTGEIKAVQSGMCTIAASTQETSSRVTINVQPKLEDIVCPSYFVEVGVGERKEWRFQTIPENAYGSDLLRVVSSDNNIAEYLGGYIVGKKTGECKIYIKTQNGSINRELRVNVRKGKKIW